MIETCATSSTAKMPMVRSKTSIRSTSPLNRTDVKSGAMTIMVPITINLTDSPLLKEGIMQEESRPFSHDLKRVRWPLNFKMSGIDKYDRSTNPAKWLEVYHLTIEATSGDSYIVANYLPVGLSSSARN
jgi:hypothetical protein